MDELIDAIERSMDWLNLEYPQLQIDKEGKKLELWILMLRDFDPLVIEAAVHHMISLGREFPPNVGQVRNQCILMSHGKLQNSTSSDAWEHVMGRVNHEDVELTPFEKKALKQTGRTINELRQTQLSNLATDRARFSEAFDRLISRQHLERITLPEVKALVARNAPALPAPAAKQIPTLKEVKRQRDAGVMSFEEARKEFGPAIDKLKELGAGL